MKTYKLQKLLDLLIIIILIFSVVSFILLPFLFVFKESFFISGHFSTKLIRDVFTKSKNITLNTFKMGFLTSILSTVSSLFLAIYIYLSSKNIKRLLIVILFITIISPPFVTSLSYITLFGRRGFITYKILNLSLNVYGMWGIVIMQSISYLSLNSLLILGFLNSLDKDIINSARNLGAKTSHIILDIIIPSAKSGIKAALFLSFFKSVSDFSTPAIIGGNFNVLALESYYSVISKGDLARASAINIIILLPSILLFFIYQKNLKSSTMSNGISYKNEIEIERKGLIYIIIKIISLLFLISLVLLYSSIIISAISKMENGKLIFTLQNIIDTKPYITGSLVRSIVYSLISAVFGSIIGLLIAYYLKIRNLKIMKFIDFIANLPYIIPGTFFGLGYLLFFKNPPLQITGTSIIVILNVLFKQLPFSTKNGNGAMENINIELLHSVRNLGGSHLNEIKDIIIPLSYENIKISFINAFTTTMTTIGSIIFLIYPGKKVLTLVMFDVIQSGKYEIGSVIALLIILVCLLVNGSYYLYNGGINVFSSKKSK